MIDRYLKIKHYSEDTPQQTVHIGEVARSLTIEQFDFLLNEFLNVGMKGTYAGRELGKLTTRWHRSLQRSFVAFFLAAITEFAEQEYSDARNETALATAKKIAQMYKDGELPIGPFL